MIKFVLKFHQEMLLLIRAISGKNQGVTFHIQSGNLDEYLPNIRVVISVRAYVMEKVKKT